MATGSPVVCASGHLKFQDISLMRLFSSVLHGLGLVTQPELHQTCSTQSHCLKFNAPPSEQAFLQHKDVTVVLPAADSHNRTALVVSMALESLLLC